MILSDLPPISSLPPIFTADFLFVGGKVNIKHHFHTVRLKFKRKEGILYEEFRDKVSINPVVEGVFPVSLSLDFSGFHKLSERTFDRA